MEITKIGERRFRVFSPQVNFYGGATPDYGLERALGKLRRKVGATVERTGIARKVIVCFPEFSKATGNPLADTSVNDVERLLKMLGA